MTLPGWEGEKRKNKGALSYDTSYSLTTEPGNIQVNEVKQAIVSLLKYSPFVDPTSWYDHEGHVKQISQQFSHLLLVLDGEGDNSDDI